MAEPKLNHPLLLRAGAEFLIIVAGVLIALALDNWNSERLDLALGKEYLRRLLSDVEADVYWFDNALAALDDKVKSLELLANAASNDAATSTDSILLLQAIPKTLVLSFNAPSVRTATFDDMMSTGRLALVTPISTREAILDYYARGTNSENRLEGRMTQYPHNVFANIPEPILAWFSITPFSSREPPKTSGTPPRKYTEAEVAAVWRWLKVDDTNKMINAERNYTSHAIQIIEGNRNEALQLIQDIENILQ